VAGVEAEAELLAAITSFFTAVGITSKDVGIKINNRKVLQAVLEKYNTPEELFVPVCGTPSRPQQALSHSWSNT
jgi:histidyl-tRNA synthetase